MSWSIEPQQMLYVTASVALYGAVLSTINFVTEQQKNRIRLKINISDGLVDQPSIIDVKIIKVINNSVFEIDIDSIGFRLNSGDNMVFLPENEYPWYQIPDSIQQKKSRIYPIRLERIKKLLNSQGQNNVVTLKPFVTVNGNSYYGKPFKFNCQKI